MTFTYDPTTSSGLVRLLAIDTSEDTYVFSDAEIEAFLAMEGGNVKRAAAQALDTIASNDAYTVKKVSLLDVSADGVSVAGVLHQRASMLRKQADTEDEQDVGGAFDVAEWITNDFALREFINNDALRGL